ncbi:MAG: DNA/RNA non-specific endonuclease [Cyclobacteriaceae bacterium]
MYLKILMWFFAFLSIEAVFCQDLSAYYPSVEGELIRHTYYHLDYNEAHEQPNWVIYFADPVGNQTRIDRFKPDPDISSGSATLDDYKGSGYDRGHLCPAADMKRNVQSMTESFFMSNMSPQAPSFNRGIWKNLEALIRNWSLANDKDLVVTGGILTETCGSIGHGVTVPCSYYKIYVDLEKMKGIGFVLKNEASSEPIQSFAVSIDEIEELTGIDFFAQLDDAQQTQIEGSFELDSFAWNSATMTRQNLAAPAKEQTGVQCQGITSAGKRCSRIIGASESYCWQHEK